MRTEDANLQKKPGTAEPLNWLTALHRIGADAEMPLSRQAGLTARCFSALTKLATDQDRVARLFEDWKQAEPDA